MKIDAGTDLMDFIDCPQSSERIGSVSMKVTCGGEISEWQHPEGYKSVEFIPDREGAEYPLVIVDVAGSSGWIVPGICIKGVFERKFMA